MFQFPGQSYEKLDRKCGLKNEKKLYIPSFVPMPEDNK